MKKEEYVVEVKNLNVKTITCPNCKTKFDISQYLTYLKDTFIYELEKAVKEIKGKLK